MWDIKGRNIGTLSSWTQHESHSTSISRRENEHEKATMCSPRSGKHSLFQKENSMVGDLGRLLSTSGLNNSKRRRPRRKQHSFVMCPSMISVMTLLIFRSSHGIC